MTLVDRALARMRISRHKLQLVGAACFLIASKYEELRPPSLRCMVALADNAFDKVQLTAMESKVLRVLDFNCTLPTAKLFLTRFLRAALSDEIEASLTKVRAAGAARSGPTAATLTGTGGAPQYLLELSLLRVGFLKYSNSVRAAACVLLARLTLEREVPWVRRPLPPRLRAPHHRG